MVADRGSGDGGTAPAADVLVFVGVATARLFFGVEDSSSFSSGFSFSSNGA